MIPPVRTNHVGRATRIVFSPLTVIGTTATFTAVGLLLGDCLQFRDLRIHLRLDRNEVWIDLVVDVLMDCIKKLPQSIGGRVDGLPVLFRYA